MCCTYVLMVRSSWTKKAHIVLCGNGLRYWYELRRTASRNQLTWMMITCYSNRLHNETQVGISRCNKTKTFFVSLASCHVCTRGFTTTHCLCLVLLLFTISLLLFCNVTDITRAMKIILLANNNWPIDYM